MGGPASPTAAQAVELAARAKVTAETRVVRVEGGEAKLSVGLPPNGVVLVLVGQAGGPVLGGALQLARTGV